MKEIEKLNIEKLIYEIRGKQVMLDSDLARLYDVKMEQNQLTLQLNVTLIDFQKDLCFN